MQLRIFLPISILVAFAIARSSGNYILYTPEKLLQSLNVQGQILIDQIGRIQALGAPPSKENQEILDDLINRLNNLQIQIATISNFAKTDLSKTSKAEEIIIKAPQIDGTLGLNKNNEEKTQNILTNNPPVEQHQPSLPYPSSSIFSTVELNPLLGRDYFFLTGSQQQKITPSAAAAVSSVTSSIGDGLFNSNTNTDNSHYHQGQSGISLLQTEFPTKSTENIETSTTKVMEKNVNEFTYDELLDDLIKQRNYLNSLIEKLHLKTIKI